MYMLQKYKERNEVEIQYNLPSISLKYLHASCLSEQKETGFAVQKEKWKWLPNIAPPVIIVRGR